MPTITVEAALHPAQEQVWTSGARFRVVGCGRRFGKTHLGVLEIIDHALHVDGAIAWWVSPTHDQSDIAWRMFLSAVPEDLVEINLTKKVVTFLHNGSRVQFKSADRDKNLRGEGLTFLVLDEAAFLKESAWYGSLRPSLSDRKGGALLIGTFDGTENYFYAEYERGQDPNHDDIESWRFPTSENPFIDAEEIEAARRSLPEVEFAQEYLADPMSFVGAVFNGAHVQDAIDKGRALEWNPKYSTYAGLDWGYTGQTAFEVCNETPDDYVHWVEERTWVATELTERCRHICDLSESHRIRVIYADAAGATENRTLADMLKHRGLQTVVKPVPFNKFKNHGIAVRRFYLERGREKIGPKCGTFARDSKRYRYEENKTLGALKEDVLKKDDHTQDAATAFYSTRGNELRSVKPDGRR